MFFAQMFGFGSLPNLLSKKQMQEAADSLPDFIKNILKESSIDPLSIVTEFSGLPQFDKIIEKCSLSPYQYDQLFKWFEKKNDEMLRTETKHLNALKADVKEGKFYMIHLIEHMSMLVTHREMQIENFKSYYEKDLKKLELL